MNLSVIILAAGKGTRMRSSLPKVMHKVANKPIIGHILSNIKSLECKEVMIVIGAGMNSIEDYVKLELSSAKCVIQQDQQGTASAVKIALYKLNNKSNDVLVLYGDHPFITSATIKKMHLCLVSNPKTALVLISFFATDQAQYGRIITSNKGELESIVEYMDCNDLQKEINLCNSGVMLVRGSLIDQLILQISNHNAKGEYYLTDLVALAINAGWRCQHITINESEVIGVNTRADLAVAENIMQHYLRQHALSSGVTLVDPSTVFFSSDTIIHQDVTVYPYVVFGDGVEIKSGAEIRSYTHIEGATIGRDVKIGPFARIRPGTEIDTKAVIGNFVEIKNGKIGINTKISHLSYIGDAKVGEGVNIGAGTITCNYDGVTKHYTEIEADVFIGSNSSLVAPVKIGARSIVAAGSVITKDVEVGALAVARGKQQNIQDKAETIRTHKKSKISNIKSSI